MTKCLGLVLVASILMLIGNTHADDTNTFTVTGEWIDRESGTPEEKQQKMNSLQTSVVIQRADATDEDLSDSPVLASASFKDGKVSFTGEIDAPTSVLISVRRDKEDPMTLSAVLIPGATTSFALWDKENSFPGVEDQLILVEDFKLQEESDTKFTITGDLSSMGDQDLSLSTASMEDVSGKLKAGSVLPSKSNAVLLRDGRFSFEGIATEPLLISLWIVDYIDQYLASVYFVVEPGAHIEISPSTTSSSFAPGAFASELLANSEVKGSMHSKIIESWQDSSEYREKLAEYARVIELKAQRAESDSENAEEPAETENSEEESIKAPYDVYQEMTETKNSMLTTIAKNLDEPMAALLAMELGVRTSMAASRKLESWDDLASVLDEDIVARRVSPQRETLDRQFRVAQNSKNIIAGQSAPNFTLANLEGENIALYDDILAKNEVVLIDFWASWCGPCVAKIPDLKKFHSEYKDKGFEIVFVSIDDTYDDWKTGSDGHEVPGINVADLNGFLGDTPVDYGVRMIPTEFLLESDGKILNRELTMEELENLLEDRFGSTEEQEEPEESTSNGDIL